MRRQLRRHAMPHHIALRIAVQQKQRRPAAAGAREDFPGRGVDPVRGVTGIEIGEVGHLFRLAFDRAPADVAAAEAFRPADPVDRLIGARLRLAHGLADAPRR